MVWALEYGVRVFFAFFFSRWFGGRSWIGFGGGWVGLGWVGQGSVG